MPTIAEAITEHYDASDFYQRFAQAYTNCTDHGALMKDIIRWSNDNYIDMYKGGGIWPITPLSQYFLMGSISPLAMTIRADDASESLKTEYEWVMITRAGNCGENSIMTLGLANLSGIPVRRVSLQGEDHVFNEAYIGGRWIVIDPLNPYNHSYDIPPRFYEDKWKYKISYAYARYPNNTIVDVTPRYTDVGYIILSVTDQSGNPVDNATVRVYSNNRVDLPPASLPLFTNLTMKTPANGTCNLMLGDGNYTITASTDGSFGKLKTPLKANETTTIELAIKPKEPVNYLVDLIKKNATLNVTIGILGTIMLSYVLLLFMKFYNNRYLWSGVIIFLSVFLAYLGLTFLRLVLIF